MLDYLSAFFGLFSSSENQLILMFISAFLSATVLPGNSEILFSTLVTQWRLTEPENASPFIALLLVATIGNSLGSFTTFLIAQLFSPPTRHQQSQKPFQLALRYSQQYGVWALLLSWLPVIGDLLCAVAGWLRLPKWQSLLFITLGKALRYLILFVGISLFIG